ncbi:MAG TPA: TraB/GumN family protein [Flavobacterium sp.]|jgi:hypothetical protein
MNKIIIGILALAGFTANAQNALLWQISGNGLKEPSYIYGTIHLTCDATLDTPTKAALDNTQQLYLELDMDDPTMMTSMMMGMMMKDGQRMSALSSAEDFALVDAYLMDKLGLSAKLVDNVKPAMVSTMLLPGLMPCALQSVEEELMRMVKQQNEEVLGLETVNDQLAVFDAIPYQVQMDELVESVKDKFAGDKAELDKMYKIYAEKDIIAMHNMMGTSNNDITAKYQDQLLYDRNAKWIPKIESIAKQKPTFFGVGAGHLAGPKGVLELLRKRGFKVEAVN